MILEQIQPRWKYRLAQVGLYGAVLALVAFLAFPYIWMTSTAFKDPSEQFRIPPTLIPDAPTFKNFAQALAPSFLQYLWNSLFVGAMTAFWVIIVSLFAAYGFSRTDFPGKKPLFVAVIYTQLFPLATIIVPIYTIMSRVGLINTYSGLFIAYLTFTVPPAVWMLRSFLESIPKELEEAAMVDGCTKFTAFLRVIIPLSRPGIFSTAAYVFFMSWQEFLFALTLTLDQSMRTVPVGILDFVGQYETNWGNLMAASILITAPVVLVFLLIQRQFIAGLTAGSVKG